MEQIKTSTYLNERLNVLITQFILNVQQLYKKQGFLILGDLKIDLIQTLQHYGLVQHYNNDSQTSLQIINDNIISNNNNNFDKIDILNGSNEQIPKKKFFQQQISMSYEINNIQQNFNEVKQEQQLIQVHSNFHNDQNKQQYNFSNLKQQFFPIQLYKQKIERKRINFGQKQVQKCKKYIMYSLKQKRQALQMVKQYGLYVTSRYLSIPHKSIMRWMQQGEINHGRGRKPAKLSMEENLSGWIRNYLNEHITITQAMIREKAKELVINDEKDYDFKASKGWLQKYFRRNIDIFKQIKKSSKRYQDKICYAKAFKEQDILQ